MKISWLILLELALFVAACSQSYFVNTDDPTNYAEGRDLYISKCSGCHQLYNPDNYSETKWDSIMVTMKMKAKIDDKQSDEIYNWIIEVKNNSSASVYKN